MIDCSSCKSTPAIPNPYFGHLGLCFDCLQKWKKQQRRISRSKRQSVLKRDGWKCVYCRTDLRKMYYDIHIDHRLPVDMGGTNDLANLQATCAYCNEEKGALSDADFRKKKFGHTLDPTNEQSYEQLKLIP